MSVAVGVAEKAHSQRRRRRRKQPRVTFENVTKKQESLVRTYFRLVAIGVVLVICIQNRGFDLRQDPWLHVLGILMLINLVWMIDLRAHLKEYHMRAGTYREGVVSYAGAAAYSKGTRKPRHRFHRGINFLRTIGSFVLPLEE